MNWNGSSVSLRRINADETETKRITPVFRLKCIFILAVLLWMAWLFVVEDYLRWTYVIPDACAIWYGAKYEPLEAAVLYAAHMSEDADADFICTHLIISYGEKNGIIAEGNTARIRADKVEQ